MSINATGATAPKPTLMGQLGWIAYEMAGGPYFNAIKIFVFAPYFAKTVVGNEIRGQELWGYIDMTAGLLIALSAPIVGSMGDAFGARKPGIFILSAITIAAMACLWFAMPGGAVLPVAVLLVATAVAAELAFMYHNSLLGAVARPERMGLLSGTGYSANYLGTLLIFVPWLVFFSLPDVPALGLGTDQSQHIRILAPAAAIWFLLFSIPFFVFTPDAARSGLGPVAAFNSGISQLRTTLTKVRHYNNIVRYLISRMIYYDGIVAIFTFIGIYAAGIFDWHEAQVGLFGLVIFSILIFAGVLGGMLDDHIGSKKTILIGITMVGVSLAVAIGMSPTQLFPGVPYIHDETSSGVPLVGPILSALGFTLLPEQVFILVSIVSGCFMGPTLASSRTMMARLAPQEMMSEFFGLYTLTGKATAFLAPGAIGLITGITQNQRAGLSIIFAFLIIGFIGMLTVKEERAVLHD